MTNPSQETVKQEYRYQTDQQVSVNAYFDIDIDGEPVRLQITTRYGATAPKIVQTTEAEIEAYRLLRQAHPRPAAAPKEAPAKVPQSEIPEGMPEGIELTKAEFDYVTIIPQPDNKASVDFYKDSLKWPVAKVVKWKHAAVKTLLVPVGDIDPAKAETYRAAGEVFWSQGKEYTKPDGSQGHYKDVRAVKATL